MSKLPKKPVPLRLNAGQKTDVRAQVAAVCYRYKGDKLRVCLITTRDGDRWIIPRGWPMHKMTAAASAAQEAYEEAGLRGEVTADSIGAYSYAKTIDGATTPFMVMVYALHVTQKLADWPERKMRKRKWLSPKKAAHKLQDKGLQQIVAQFDPARKGAA